MYSCLLMEVMMVNKYYNSISYISNDFEKKWSGTKNLTKILSKEKYNNSYKNIDRVLYSCLLMKVMMANKCWKFQSNIDNGFKKQVNWYKQLNQTSRSKKGHNYYKTIDRVLYSYLLMDVLMVNKCCKFQSKICNGFGKKCIGIKDLTKVWQQRRRQHQHRLGGE